MYENWTAEHIQKIETLKTYGAMKDVALEILRYLPPPVAQVCGPLSTGGRGSFEENLKAFHAGIQFVAGQGKTVFDQRPFEGPMQKVKTMRQGPGYAYELLEEFYLPIFESGYIKEVHFLPGWESSTGARWEHGEAERLGLAIFYIPNHV